ncbi:fimbrial protein [Enterobacter sp. ECC-175]|uniref:fimbrial protein n=2 Tax=Enterobacter TaxID=547 RepID=UPI0037554030
MKTWLKFSLILLCTGFLWGKSTHAMAATCKMDKADPLALVEQNYTFSSNSNGTSSKERPMSTSFWPGNADTNYICTTPPQAMWLCGTDTTLVAGSTSSQLAPGISGNAYVSNGASTSGDYGGCYGTTFSSAAVTKGPMPSALWQWHYVGVRLNITDSSVARNITLNSKRVGYIYLADQNMSGKALSGGQEITDVNVSGTVTIPASCKLASNSVVVLPDTYAVDFGKAGAGGEVGTGTKQTMTISCLGGSDEANIDLHVTSSKTSGTDIVTSNPDIGVRVLNPRGETISANNGEYTASQYQGASHIDFTYVPVALTGKNPEAGDYSAIETITVTQP